MEPMTPSDADPVRDYIRAHMQQHTREAIREQLIAGGHDPHRIDSVWEEEWRRASAMPNDLVAATGRNMTTLAWILLIIGGVVGAFGALLLASISGTYAAEASIPVFIGVYAAAYIGIGYGLVRLVRWAIPRFRITGWLAFLIGVALVPAYGALMFGGCAAAFNLAERGV
jgi:hypothetical protein